VHVTVLDGLSLSLPSSFTLQFGDSVLLEPVIGFAFDSLIWSPSSGLSCSRCQQPWAQPDESTDYAISVWSIEGCLVIATVQIEVDRNPKIFIPNVFSPNGDDINDVFAIIANREVTLIRNLVLYDRWGGVLWEGTNFVADGTFGWDGTSGGELMLPGVYVWSAEIEFRDGSTDVRAGDVTLVR
jgi:gliding motility-associated-like protein